MARGGGSLEDLWAFNDERVVRAITVCPVPVITGIGHETDFTLADFAADLRAPTPTGAAVLCTPDKADLLTELLGARLRLNSAILSCTARRWQDLDSMRQRLGFASPGRRIQNGKEQVRGLHERQGRAMRHLLQLQRAKIEGLGSRLGALNPSAVLQRGYALVTREDGRVVISARQVQGGERVDIHLRDGRLITRVEQVEPNDDALKGK
jgi:exodeoxyribonuclease VII large subunit